MRSKEALAIDIGHTFKYIATLSTYYKELIFTDLKLPIRESLQSPALMHMLELIGAFSHDVADAPDIELYHPN